MPGREQHLEAIRRKFLRLNRELLGRGVALADLERAGEAALAEPGGDKKPRGRSLARRVVGKKLLWLALLPLLYSLAFGRADPIDYAIKQIQGARCLLPSNYLAWEFTRPVSSCDFCRGVRGALVLDNVTREQFAPHAYSSKPIIVKRAASHWMASRVFSLQFFRSLYDNINGAYESVTEECQFLHFRSDFADLREVLSMSERRAMNLPGEEPWYVGWKNCHPQVLEIMNKFFRPPHFLPADAEMPNTNYVFLGYDQGANMHLDYIPRLMWQGQIIGSKTWTVAPTPECDDVCEKFSFFVDTGDVVLLDTRIWYHGTHVENGKFSLTITSEYG